MVAPFDIFKTEPDGSVLWLECCTDLEVAKAHVKNFAPGAYFILSQRTGHRLAIEVEESKAVARARLSA